MTWHAVDWGGALPSPLPGRLRWLDIKDIVPPEADTVSVIVVDRAGPPLTTKVRIGKRWAGRGWSRMLQCPRCSRPAGVLGLHHGKLLCAQCHPRPSRRHREHKTRRWNEFDGELEDALLRAVNSPASSSSGRLALMAQELLARDGARVDAIAREAEAFLAAVDEVLGESTEGERDAR